MFEKFLSKFNLDESQKNNSYVFDFFLYAEGLEYFLNSYSGSSFNGGLYRIHSTEYIKYWTRVVGKTFPEFSKRILCFGYDWLGRQFALDSGRMKSGEPLILMLEPGTAEVLEIPVSFLQFHEEELVNYANEALAYDFFKIWLSAKNKPPSYNQCVSYKTPLFLGGIDSIENLELMDLDVYWNISKQLIGRVREFTLGEKITNISIE